MNIFRFIADMLHVTAILLLIYRIKKSRNCIGKYQVTTRNPPFPNSAPHMPRVPPFKKVKLRQKLMIG